MTDTDKARHTIPLPKQAVLLSALLLFTCCSKTFLVSKDCTTYFFGSQDQAFYKKLCTSGDLQKVLADAVLPEDARAGLYEAQCIDRSREKLDRIYASLSRDQQETLKSAFRRHGYEINAKPAPNYQFYPYYDNVNYCPPGGQY